ncbi:hypothetical protein RQP46_006746 [Phenoliferia psychrophenolica]
MSVPASANFCVSVAYPRTEKTFDMAYYVANHMPLCQKHWPQVLGWNVVEYAEGPNAVLTSIYFGSKETFDAAIASEATPTIMADLPNYTDAQPVLAGGAIKARS